jgi:hypothetical protein
LAKNGWIKWTTQKATQKAKLRVKLSQILILGAEFRIALFGSFL